MADKTTVPETHTLTAEQSARLASHVEHASRYLTAAADAKRIGVPHHDAVRMARAHVQQAQSLVPGCLPYWHQEEMRALGLPVSEYAHIA